jgi:hypothetical protein
MEGGALVSGFFPLQSVIGGIIYTMSYQGQRDYKSCKVQSHTTKKLLNKIKTHQLLIGAEKNLIPMRHLP